MVIHSAFGLGLATKLAIPRLASAPPARRADIRIELNDRPAWFERTMPVRIIDRSDETDESGTPMRTLGAFSNGWLRLSYVDGHEFIIAPDGTEVWATWPAVSSIDDMSSYLLGPVMGFLLRLRGRVCLHASGVAVGGRVLAIAGASGSGKSTTAAALAACGYPLVSDDVTPLVRTGDVVEVTPSYPRVRLWPSALDALIAIDGSVPRLPSDWGDRRYHMDVLAQGYAYQTEPLPLGAIYVMGERSEHDDAPRVGALSGTEGLIALISHSFSAALFDRRMRAHDFDVMGHVVSSIPLRHVHAHVDPLRLSRLCDRILEDFLTTVEPQAISA